MVAGHDPRTFYRGAKLADVDIRGQDLRGMDFTGADFEGVVGNANTKLDDDFRAEFADGAIARVREIISRSVFRLDAGERFVELAILGLAFDRDDAFDEGLNRLSGSKDEPPPNFPRLATLAPLSKSDDLSQAIRKFIKQHQLHPNTLRSMIALLDKRPDWPSREQLATEWFDKNPSLPESRELSKLCLVLASKYASRDWIREGRPVATMWLESPFDMTTATNILHAFWISRDIADVFSRPYLSQALEALSPKHLGAVLNELARRVKTKSEAQAFIRRFSTYDVAHHPRVRTALDPALMHLARHFHAHLSKGAPT